MKVRNFSIIVMLISYVLLIGSHRAMTQNTASRPAAQPSPSPSLAATYAWLKKTIIENGTVDPGGGMTDTYESVSFSNCIMQVNHRTTFENSDSWQVHEVTYPLTKLDESKIRVIYSNSQGFWIVPLWTIGDPARSGVMRFIKKKTYGIDMFGEKISKEEFYGNSGLTFDDESIANRIANALSHAIKLCKAQPKTIPRGDPF